MVDPVTQFITSLGSMGLGALVMWKWLMSEKQGRRDEKAEYLSQIAELKKTAEDSNEREREMTRQVIEALLLNKRILEENQIMLDKGFSNIKVGHASTMEYLEKISEILEDSVVEHGS